MACMLFFMIRAYIWLHKTRTISSLLYALVLSGPSHWVNTLHQSNSCLSSLCGAVSQHKAHLCAPNWLENFPLCDEARTVLPAKNPPPHQGALWPVVCLPAAKHHQHWQLRLGSHTSQWVGFYTLDPSVLAGWAIGHLTSLNLRWLLQCCCSARLLYGYLLNLAMHQKYQIPLGCHCSGKKNTLNPWCKILLNYRGMISFCDSATAKYILWAE